ncbi:hypothetical protein B0H14DRAFT_3498681 [Mycena olivaceomarginata]|nr:hypothetical protein B0H14DRAFT_3498681 [Mycena olivaceomarginata]
MRHRRFQHGHDLLLPSGLPWQVILPQVACRTTCAGIRDQLLEENLVTAEQLSECLALFGDRDKIYLTPPCFALNQEFAVNFSASSKPTVVGQALAFNGTALGVARFEPSTDPQYGRRRVVHLRITKIITPVSRSTMIQGHPEVLLKPEEGKLLTRCYRGVELPEPWAYDIDEKESLMATALRVLWDNSRIP